jgi:hypothetical protein
MLWVLRLFEEPAVRFQQLFCQLSALVTNCTPAFARFTMALTTSNIPVFWVPSSNQKSGSKVHETVKRIVSDGFAPGIKQETLKSIDAVLARTSLLMLLKKFSYFLMPFSVINS